MINFLHQSGIHKYYIYNCLCLRNSLYYGRETWNHMLVDRRTFCELALALLMRMPRGINRLSHFKSLHEIASSIDAMCPAAKDSGLVVCSSCIRQSWRRGTRRAREVINYQGRARRREKKRIRACEDRYL